MIRSSVLDGSQKTCWRSGYCQLGRDGEEGEDDGGFGEHGCGVSSAGVSRRGGSFARQGYMETIDVTSESVETKIS